MIIFLVIILPILTLAIAGIGFCVGWRAAKDITPITLPSLPSIRRQPRDETPKPTLKPQENP